MQRISLIRDAYNVSMSWRQTIMRDKDVSVILELLLQVRWTYLPMKFRSLYSKFDNTTE